MIGTEFDRLVWPAKGWGDLEERSKKSCLSDPAEKAYNENQFQMLKTGKGNP